MRLIRHKFRYWTNKNYRQELRVRQKVNTYFAGLPHCKEAVLIAHPSCGKGEYQCSITIPVERLLAWMMTYAEHTSLSWLDEITWPYFQNWLSKADTKDKGVSPLPKFLFQALETQISDWVMNEEAQVWCHSCDATVTDITNTRSNRGLAGNSHYWWVSEWRCPAKHELYRTEQEVRIQRLSHYTRSGK